MGVSTGSFESFKSCWIGFILLTIIVLASLESSRSAENASCVIGCSCQNGLLFEAKNACLGRCLIRNICIPGESAVHGDVGQQNEKLCIFTKKALHIQLDR